MVGMKSIRVLGLILILIGTAAAQTPGTFGTPQSIGSIFDTQLATAAAQASTVTIAHFPYGGGYGTRVVLSNSSGTGPVTVDVAFFDPSNGQPTSVPLEGKGSQSTEHFVIAPNAIQVINADPSQRNVGSTKVAWATASANGPLTVFSAFDFFSPTTTFAVGAPSTVAAKTFRFPVSANGPLKYNAGLAVANPNNGVTTVTVKLLNGNGTVKGSVVKTLQAFAQTIFLLNQSDIFGSQLGSAAFDGSVAICADKPVGLVALGAEKGALFSTAITNDACPQ